MGSRFSFTDEALANLRLFGVTPGEVWEALHSTRGRGRHLAVLLAEAGHGDNDWDVLSARDLSDSETKRYTEAVRGTR